MIKTLFHRRNGFTPLRINDFSYSCKIAVKEKKKKSKRNPNRRNKIDLSIGMFSSSPPLHIPTGTSY